MMADAVTRYIEGPCTGVEQKPGSDMVTFQISIPGKQYPVKLKTKHDKIIEQGKAVGANHATWKYTEKESANINPHSGNPYIDRWLEAVRPGSVTPEGYVDPGPVSGTATAGGTGGSGGGELAPGRSYTEEDIKRFDDRERRDYMSRSWAHTMTALAHTVKVDEDRDELFARLQGFQRKIYNDICGLFAYPEDKRDVPSEAGAGEWDASTPEYDPDPLPPDDDIPF